MHRFKKSRLLLVAALFVAPVSLRAQTKWMGVQHESMSCVEHLPPSVFKRVAVYASVSPRDSVSPLFAATADNLVQDLVIRAWRLLGSTSNVLPHGEPAVDWRGTDAPLPVTAYRDGRIVAHDTTADSTTAAKLLARALASDSTGGVLEWSADSARDSIRFDIDFARPLLDSAGRVTNPSLKRVGIPLLSIMAPWERQVSQKPGQRGPRYPAGARYDGYSGKVLMQMIIDTTGHVVVSTMKDLWPSDKPRLTGRDSAAYHEFVKTVEDYLPALEFNPAIIGGCKVRQLVQMPFVFSLGR